MILCYTNNKKHFIALLTLVIILSSCTSKQGYLLEGTLNGFNGKEVYLTTGIDYVVGDTIATAKIVDGSFTFEDESLKKASPFSIILPKSDLRNYRVMLFLEQGVTKMQLDTAKTMLEMDWSELMLYPELATEGKTTLAYQEFLEKRYDLFKDDDKSKKGAQKMTVFIETYNAGKSFEKKWLDNFTKTTNWYTDKFEQLRYDFVLNTKNPQVAKHILVHEGVGFSQSYSPKELQAALDSLEIRGVEKDSVFTNLEHALANMQKASIGSIAPNFNLETATGQLSDLKNYAGKYVFLDFWAYWCKPCIKEFPHLKKVHSNYAGSNFEIVSIHADPKKDKWEGALEKYALPWPQLFDTVGENTTASEYNVEFLPTTFLINPEGEIVAKNLSGAALDEKLKELFSN